MVDRHVVQTRLAHIAEQLDKLYSKKRHVSRQNFLADDDLQALILHRLQTAVQGCIDLASHLVADEGWELSAGMMGLFDILARHRVIAGSLANKMTELVRLRNEIVHDYASLNLGKIYRIWQREIQTIARFCQAIKRYAKL